MANSDQNLPQAQLGQYTLLEKIAQGGMAQVFKAKTVDPQGIERLVVIKRILPHISSNPEYVDMLVNEAKVAVHFTHGNIAQVYDLGRINDDYFIVMEYVDGKTFSQINKALLEKGHHFPLEVLLYCFIELCRGLAYIHRKADPEGKPLGVVHRDVSPQNIILTYAGNIKLIDFGVAKADVREEKTESGVLKGKFAYMSPEQSRGEPIDFRSDIFSIGILLWELLTGDRLFKQKNNQDTLKAVQKAKFDPVTVKQPHLPKELDVIIKRALQRKPKDRYNDCADIASDLEKLLLLRYPDFKPVQAAQFLYDLFGPEADEAGLPLPAFIQAKPAKKYAPVRPLHEDDEPTIKERPEAGTPVVRMPKVPKQTWLMVLLLGVIAVVFTLGSYYAHYVYLENQKSFLILSGIESSMQVWIDGVPAEPSKEASLEAPFPFVVQAGTEHVLKVSQKGFHDFKTSFQLQSRQTQTLSLKLEPLIPPFGDLTIETLPGGATVFLDGMEWRQKTPVRINHLKAGKTYRISLSLENYQEEARQVIIQGGKEVRLEQPMQIAYATLHVTTDPAGAVVTFDDQEVGKTPYNSAYIQPAESFRLSVSLVGYDAQARDLTLEAGQEKSLSFVLIPQTRQPDTNRTIKK